jgi:pyruvate formate lyase activating enzyme
MKIGGLEKTTLIDYPGKVACMIYTIGCNFRCPYCHNPELVDETAEIIDTETIFNFLKERKPLLDGVVITGGEPTMHDDLLEFMKRIKDLGYLIKLDSNGTRPEMISKAISMNLVDYIAMDMKSPLEKYSQQVARPVNTEAIKESIRIIMRSFVDYEFRTTVVKSLLSQEDIVSIAQSIRGAKKYYLQRFIPAKILNPQLLRKATYSIEEFENLKNIVSPYVHYCGIR